MRVYLYSGVRRVVCECVLLLKAKADKSDSTLKEGPRDLDVRRGFEPAEQPDHRKTNGEEVCILCGKTKKKKEKKNSPQGFDCLFVVRES